MYYRGYYIETNGRCFRAYRKKLFGKDYIMTEWENIGNGFEGCNKEIFSDIAGAKLAIDFILAPKDKDVWRLVEPLDGCPEI